LLRSEDHRQQHRCERRVDEAAGRLEEMGALQAASRGRGSNRLGSGKALVAKYEERV
jgi:hypothetical protein